MIPQKRKSPAELAALREHLGIPPEAPDPGSPRARSIAPATAAAIPDHLRSNPEEAKDSLPANDTSEPIKLKERHSLRRHELPLAPAERLQHSKTELPSSRHSNEDLSFIRKSEVRQQLLNPGLDLIAQIKQESANRYLIIITYVLIATAAFAAYRGVLVLTPTILLAIAALMTLYIAVRKKRSRHHAAILSIVLLFVITSTAAYYAPSFFHGT